jgi:hypothetical protein
VDFHLKPQHHQVQLLEIQLGKKSALELQLQLEVQFQLKPENQL